MPETIQHTTAPSAPPCVMVIFGAKTPGPFMNLGNVEMDFCYADYFGNPPTTGYETLIYDCMNGDATLFKHAENVEAGWEFVQPILDVWHALPHRDFPNCAAGSWGPKAAGDGGGSPRRRRTGPSEGS